MWFSISPHSAQDRTNEAVALLLSAFHQAKFQEPIELSIQGRHGSTQVLAKVPSSMHSLFATTAADLLPDCRVTPQKKQPQSDSEISKQAVIRLTPECFSLLDSVANTPTRDRATALFSALRTGDAGTIQSEFRIKTRPASDKRRRKVERLAKRLSYHPSSRWLGTLHRRLALRRGYLSGLIADWLIQLSFRKSLGQSDHASKLKSHLYECVIIAVVSGPPDAKSTIEHRLTDILGTLGGFTDDSRQFSHRILKPRHVPTWRHSCVLMPVELAEIWHPPRGESRIAGTAQADVQELEPPRGLATQSTSCGTAIGKVVYRRQKHLVTLSPPTRMRHAFIIGKTGCGKSTLLLNMIADDIRKGRSVCVLDPHGELVETLLDQIPTNHTNDVLLFDVADTDLPVGFNPMATFGKLNPTLVVDGVVTAFQNVFGFDAGSAPRLLHIFRNCLLALVTPQDQHTLVSVQRMLIDEPFRQSVVAKIENPAVRQFWNTEFGHWRPADRTAFVASLQNKLGAYLSNPMLAGIVSVRRGDGFCCG